VFGFEIYRGVELVFGVKIYKPNKKGDLKLKKTVSPEDCLKRYWKNRDPYRSGMVGNTGVKYHRIGKLAKCTAEGCDNTVDDARFKTCSLKCRLKKSQVFRRLKNDKK
jgi:hypothetical protein